MLFLLYFSLIVILIPCYRFLQYRQNSSEDISDAFINIFRDKYRTPLKHVALRNCTISDEGMSILLNHDLISLSMWYCDNVSTQSWRTLIEHGQCLQVLELGRYVDLLKYTEPNEKTPIDFELNLPSLRKLILNAVVLQPTLQFTELKSLSYLDLTACIFAEFSLESLVDLPNLSALILFNVWPLESELPAICKMKKLKILDISTAYGASATISNGNGSYKNPNKVL